MTPAPQTRLHNAARIFFREGPGVLRWLAGIIALAAVAGTIAIALKATNGFDPRVLLYGLVFLIPAALSLALSRTIARRSVWTVPLTWLLCVLSLLTLRALPMAAIGAQPHIVTLIGVRIVGALEMTLAVALSWFVYWLWRSGQLKGKT